MDELTKRDRVWRELRDRLLREAAVEAQRRLWSYQDDLAFNVAYLAWLQREGLRG